ncbi:MAG TPA: DUF2330 domain-containing protein [Polyangiaceae bacterium]|nr:DUF2330 domain-containing protein [Polyangiaceae bacterium]
MALTSPHRKRAWLGGVLTALAVSGASPRAEACGGFFCSASPVDQTAEHILFTVNSDQTVTAIVQIQYSGDKDNFAWIVPAPGIPKLTSDFPDSGMRALAQATDPKYFKNVCYRGAPGVASEAPHSVDAGVATDNGVTVLATQAVGPYDTTTLEATSSTVLVDWLQTHDYRITTKMIPLLEPYVEAGMNFVALRLQANKDVSDIQPLGMTYDANKPMIPLRLTAVAAQPEMGIVAWILADEKWAPENYIDLKIPDSSIQFDEYGNQNNYLTLVSSESDKVGGQAFVTEYAKPTSELASQLQGMFAPTQDGMDAKTAILDVLSQHPYITRLYARLSAEEMTADPTFMVASKQVDVDNIHDLSDPNLGCQSSILTPPRAVDPCTFDYCGRRGVCVATSQPGQNGGAATTTTGCACASDAVARVTTTGGGAATYCESVAANFDGAAPDGGAAITVTDACAGVDCGGHGTCVAMNGNPTCQCSKGYAAAVSYSNNGGTGIACQAVSGAIPPLPVLPAVGSTKLPPAQDSQRSGGCNVTPKSRGTTVALFGAFAGLALALLRRRRR